MLHTNLFHITFSFGQIPSSAIAGSKDTNVAETPDVFAMLSKEPWLSCGGTWTPCSTTVVWWTRLPSYGLSLRQQSTSRRPDTSKLIGLEHNPRRNTSHPSPSGTEKIRTLENLLSYCKPLLPSFPEWLCSSRWNKTFKNATVICSMPPRARQCVCNKGGLSPHHVTRALSAQGSL